MLSSDIGYSDTGIQRSSRDIFRRIRGVAVSWLLSVTCDQKVAVRLKSHLTVA